MYSENFPNEKSPKTLTSICYWSFCSLQIFVVYILLLELFAADGCLFDIFFFLSGKYAVAVISRVNSLIPIQFVFFFFIRVIQTYVVRVQARLKIASARCANICEWHSFTLFIIIIACSILSMNFLSNTNIHWENSNHRTAPPTTSTTIAIHGCQCTMHLPPRRNGKTHSQHTMRLAERRNNSDFPQFHNICTGILFGQFSIACWPAAAWTHVQFHTMAAEKREQK